MQPPDLFQTRLFLWETGVQSRIDCSCWDHERGCRTDVKKQQCFSVVQLLVLIAYEDGIHSALLLLLDLSERHNIELGPRLDW